MRRALHALAVALLLPCIADAQVTPASDSGSRVGIAWNDTDSCPVSKATSAAFVTAYSSANDPSTVAAGKALSGELAPCVVQVAQQAAASARTTFGILTDTNMENQLGSALYALLQVELVTLNAAVRVQDYESAKAAYTMIAQGERMSESGFLLEYRREMRLLSIHAVTAAKQIPGFAPS
jgi:hypothetical protein